MYVQEIRLSKKNTTQHCMYRNYFMSEKDSVQVAALKDKIDHVLKLRIYQKKMKNITTDALISLLLHVPVLTDTSDFLHFFSFYVFYLFLSRQFQIFVLLAPRKESPVIHTR